tara:strand:+ start:581 stop:1438 length:858 start_codon:yes stop_codon:yes gene_type:complete
MNNFKKSSLFYLLISLINTPLVGDNFQLNFADGLYKRGDYTQAVVEYKRYIMNPINKDKDLRIVYLQLLRSYYLSSMYSEGINFIQSEININYLPDDVITMLKYYSGLFYLKSDFPESAKIILKDNIVHPKSIILTITSNIYLADWDENVELLNKLKNQNNSNLLLVTNELEDLLNNTKKMKPKNPITSGILSLLIPGSGYANIGKYQTAITSFLINFSLIGSAYELQKNELYFTGGTVMLIASGWYIGSIWGSVSETYKYNKNRHNYLVDKFMEDQEIFFGIEY